MSLKMLQVLSAVVACSFGLEASDSDAGSRDEAAEEAPRASARAEQPTRVVDPNAALFGRLTPEERESLQVQFLVSLKHLGVWERYREVGGDISRLSDVEKLKVYTARAGVLSRAVDLDEERERRGKREYSRFGHADDSPPRSPAVLG